MGSRIEEARQPDYFGRDHKSRLQERLQSLGRSLPHYRVPSETGPEHRKLFAVQVVVDGESARRRARDGRRRTPSRKRRAWRWRPGLTETGPDACPSPPR